MHNPGTATSASPILHRWLHHLETLSEYTGRLASWLALAMVLLAFGVVLAQKFLNLNLQKSYDLALYFHACLFMFGIAYTLKHDAHVRVDIFYQKFSPKTQAWIDLCGSIVFLLPMCVFLFVNSWRYVLDSWAIHEGSISNSGLELIFLLKTVMLIMPVLLALQGIAVALRCILVIRGEAADPHPEHDVQDL